MNTLIIPPGANWYNSSILTCTSDNTIIYGSRKDLIVINPKNPTEAADVRVLSLVHNENIVSVSSNNNWNDPDKYVVSAAEDGYIKLWDLNTYTLKSYHNGHELRHHDKIVSVCISGQRVVSVTENGHIIVWRFMRNYWDSLPDIFNQRVKVKCMSSCPHATWRTAFGLASGLVVVADLRSNKVLYKMRAHNDEITDLSWCPTPRNIYKSAAGQLIEKLLKTKTLKKKYVNKDEQSVPKSNEESVTDKDETSISLAQNDKQETDLVVTEGTDTKSVEVSTTDIDDISECVRKIKLNSSQVEVIETAQHIEDDLFSSEMSIPISSEQPDDESEAKKFGPRRKLVKHKIDKKNPWANVEFQDSDEEIDSTSESVEQSGKANFLQECEEMKKILEYVGRDSLEDVKENESVNESGTNSSESALEQGYTSKENEDEKDGGIDEDKSENLVQPTHIEDSKQLQSENYVDDNIKEVDAKSTDSVQIKNAVENLERTEDNADHLMQATQEEFSYESTDCTFSADDETEDNVGLYFQSTNNAGGDTVEHLLASACKGGLICIWRAATDGRLQLQLSTLNQRTGNKKKRDDKKNRFISLCWARPTTLLSSNPQNELCDWNLLPVPEKHKKVAKSTLFKPRLVHVDHSRCIFKIAVPFRLYPAEESESNWRMDEDIRVWTVSKDKWLICTSLSKNRQVYASYPCIGGFVNSIAVSPVDPNRLAIGMSDTTIGLIDLSRSQPQQLVMQRIWEKVKSKVHALSWHPTQENFLAFGTAEGRVGEYDVYKVSKPPVLFSNYHRHAIVVLQWGPLMEAEDGIYGLYSCANAELVVHDACKPLKEPVRILSDMKVSNFSWKPDYKILAVGTFDGKVHLYNKQLELLEVLYGMTKTVTNLAWHPIATAMDNGISPRANNLAVAAKQSNIFVYNCTPDTKSEIVALLQGHLSAVTKLNWCPHISGRLVSASEDGSSIVWDVSSEKPIAYYKSPQKDNVLSICWSPLDADLIISGGKDCLLKIWRVTKNPVPENFEEEKEKQVKTTEPSVAVTKQKNQKCTLENSIHLKPFIQRKHYNDKGKLLKFCSVLLEKHCMESESKSEDSPKSDVQNIQQFYTLLDRKIDVKTFVEDEQNLAQKANAWSGSIFIGLIKGDVQKEMKSASEAGIFNPWIISLAPLVSHEFWLEMCEKYAEELVERDQILMASSYYLACHKVDKAVTVLCEKKYFIEALTLARSRLCDDKVIQWIIDSWVKWASFAGQFELTAAILLHEGKLNEAAEILYKREDKQCLEIAAKLAEQLNNTSLLEAINLKLQNLSKPESKNEEDRIDDNGVINIKTSRFEAITSHSSKLSAEDISTPVVNLPSSEKLDEYIGDENVVSEENDRNDEKIDNQNDVGNNDETSEVIVDNSEDKTDASACSVTHI